MPWYAVEALDDALDATKSLLTPLDVRQWLKLALVVFFLGSGGGSGPSFSAGGSTGTPSDGPGTTPGPGQFDVPAEFGDVLPILLGLVAVGLLVGLLYVLVGAVMEFVFVESLRRQHVRIRDYAGQHFGRALQLFVFRVALGLLVVVPALALVASVVGLATGGLELSLGLLVGLIPLVVLFGLLVAAIDAFTANFVVPVMIQKNVGVLGGWRRFWPTLTREWKQFGVYALVRVVLAFAAGLVSSVVGGIVGALLVAPVAVVGVLGVSLVGGLDAVLGSPLALTALVVVVLAYVLLLVAVLAVVFVPIQTYLRYHALLVLGDADRDFDLIPELRREIRESG
ncbi:hypothetical protein M0R88_14620 [Halorussus gelatinilyticus]|uniref:Glycerophosphoryl diester phosphodiesterase membrane domain-containing protein n=1 Tax=Halorussus gelatinilyticus TaxID=2937524 RepID=A0A8U0IGC0_9EURY|nr:hypothetical protein [Halorussus gelatinilyticus]UPV99740.1 hypothetical protein M0R88_14620 [Halorussus gelatinilyticus]